MSVKHVACRHCGKETPRDSRFFPFCSRRCRLIDLGQWLDESFRVPERSGLDEDERARNWAGASEE